MTEELSRTSALASRHTALGSGLEDWNGMGTAWTYNSDPNDEHDAVREAAGLFDMSPLKKVFVRGADAQSVLDFTVSRDMTKLETGRSAYLSVLTPEGTMADDAIVSKNSDDEWMIVHGSGDTMALLQESAVARHVTVELDDDLHDISFQGPKSLEILNPHASIDVGALAYFDHAEAEVFGHKCRISRTGYSGERGYEIFASGDVIGDIWDSLLEAGKDQGVMPCSFTALDKVRIEAGLLFYGYDMTTDHSPFDVGLGFTISRTKANYRGKDAALASEANPIIQNVCLVIDHNDMVAGGETLSLDGKDVGVVNSPCYSHRLGKSLALAHVAPDAAGVGTKLGVAGDEIDTTAEVVAMPIYDPDKSNTHA